MILCYIVIGSHYTWHGPNRAVVVTSKTPGGAWLKVVTSKNSMKLDTGRIIGSFMVVAYFVKGIWCEADAISIIRTKSCVIMLGFPVPKPSTKIAPKRTV